VAKEGGEIIHDAEHNILKAQHLEGGVRINAFIRWKCFAG